MRIPLAIKLLASFLATVAVGALSGHLSLAGALGELALQGLARELDGQADLIALHLASHPPDQLVLRARTLAASVPHRVTVVAPNGSLVFDSQADALPEKLGEQPEIREALQNGRGQAVRPAPPHDEPWLYTAAQVRELHGIRAVVRVAAPTSKAVQWEDAEEEAMGLAAALSLSMALMLAFAAVFWLVRPLKRMQESALSLAQGELSVRVEVDSDDELGDLAVALQAVGAQLRARLAVGGGGEALLGQLVHAMVQGVVVIGKEGRVHHVNGVARSRLGLRGPQESERMARLLGCEAVHKAIQESVTDPHGVDMRVPHPVSGEPIDGTVVALRRSDGEPLYALILDVRAEDSVLLPDLPDPRDVVAVPFRQLMDRALRRAREDLEDSAVNFSIPDEWPATTVADVNGRVERAVSDTLLAAARAPGTQANTALTATLQDGSVCLRVNAVLSTDFLASLEPRLAPLGGHAVAEQGMVQLWLPRA